MPICMSELAKFDAVHFSPVNASPGLGLLRWLLRIVLPSLYTREALLLTAHSTFLVLYYCQAVEARLEDEYRASVGRVGRESEFASYLRTPPSFRHVLLSSNAPAPHILTYRAFFQPIPLSIHPSSIFQNLNQYPSQICVAYERTEDFVITLRSAAGLIAIPLLIMRKRSRGAGVMDEEGKEKRLMYAYKDLQEVAGLTGRLYTLLSTLHNLPPPPPPHSPLLPQRTRTHPC
ncbi:hypothetical protein DFJ58DRAFT_914404 [Suillus subalutaceus]|uniref:uncharacterized protein n=1 Tax=Suillus subalutaceus TaxID=48586 RepID=UPI001B882C91|nr:uncharacterized protein DFJ58DRAFT_914404 [Suillus subalutaceus]KAG1852252.1 hypothetical protein DFJ58DRAFT_914404 [Suillus subalutaceus]